MTPTGGMLTRRFGSQWLPLVLTVMALGCEPNARGRETNPNAAPESTLLGPGASPSALPPGTLPRLTWAALEGKVTRNSIPVASALVTVRLGEPVNSECKLGEFVHSTRTDSNGRFRLLLESSPQNETACSMVFVHTADQQKASPEVRGPTLIFVTKDKSLPKPEIIHIELTAAQGIGSQL